MPSNHIQRINDDIQRTLASLLREVKDPRVQQGDLLSIVRTETTGDLRRAMTIHPHLLNGHTCLHWHHMFSSSQPQKKRSRQ